MESTPRPRTTGSRFMESPDLRSLYVATPDLDPIIEQMAKSKEKDRMTFWSRYDPIRQPKGNTDHWAKYRQTARCNRPGARVTVLYEHGRVKKLHQKNFDDLVLDGLHGNPPGSYMEMRPRNSANKSLYRNQYHERAKDNFRYWLIERPKPTSFGKYSTGAYKAILGLCMAPRT